MTGAYRSAGINRDGWPFATTAEVWEQTMTDRLLEPHSEWLEARGISSKLAERFGLKSVVTSFPPEGESEEWVRAKAIAIPYLFDGQVVNHKYRRVDPKQHVMDPKAKRCLWNVEAIDRAAGGTLIITEGEWDAMIAEDLGHPACSVPNGTPKKVSDDPANDNRYEYLWEVSDRLAKVKEFIIATDGDAPGIALRTDLIALLTPQRCSFLEYPDGCKDLTDVRVQLGIEAASKLLLNAKPVPVEGLHRLSDFPDMPPLEKIDLLDIAEFDELWGLVPSTFSVITGFPGHGKSSLVFKLIANAIAKGVNVGMGSFETVPKPVLERRLLAALVELGEWDASLWSHYAQRRALEDRFVLIANTPDEEHELDLEKLLDLAEVAVRRYGIKLLVLDPFNEIEHKRGRDETETEYIGRFIRAVKRFAHRTGVAVWIVVHPRKPSTDGAPTRPPSLYDLAGSANWNNKADYGVVVHRPDLTQPDVLASVVKVRMGLPGRVGNCPLQFLPARSKYVRSYAFDANGD